MARVPVIVLVALLATGCSIEDGQGEPRCEGGNTANIAAQSVPTASLVFCLEPLPDGWSVDNVRIDQDGTLIRLDSDRAGDDAAILHYTEACEVGDAVYTVSELDGAERYDLIEQVAPNFRAKRFYTFEGGCLWWEFDFAPEATSALSIELGDRLYTITRDEMNRAVRDSFIDEDL